MEIDRTALSIHTLGRADGRVRAHMESIGAPVPSLLIAMAHVLLKRPFSFADAQLDSRYTSPDDLRRILDAHVRAGLLVGEYEATPLARDAATLVIENQAELITPFWRGADVSLVEEIVAALDDTELPAFRQQRDALPRARSEEHRLLMLLTLLRYVRADVHAAALARHGILLADARAVEARWRAGEAMPVRDAVERDTDASFLRHLGGRDGELLALLRTLPGEDSR